ncbi:MAG: crossover junction endodeoxyribonuclease RuvC [Candidatus Berkelbacteria bacterium]|nr:crossover junction endodeoxyribonuclease RuvC [Candidatus Berkelbacteria bacterium]
MKILGIDPGTARIGWGLVASNEDKVESLGFGLIKTHQATSPEKRLEHIFRQISAIIISEKPDLIAIERLFFCRNVTTAMAVSEARGVILLAASINKTEIAEYTPMQIKEAVTGYGRADKKQVAEMVKTILKLKEGPKIDDTADALGVAICASGAAKFAKKIKIEIEK